MKKMAIIFILSSLFVSLILSRDFSSDFSSLRELAVSCQKEYVFYEELYDMNSTVSFADAVVIPFETINPGLSEYGYTTPTAAIYLKVNDYYGIDGLYDFTIDSVRISGMDVAGNYILDELSAISILSQSFIMDLSDYDCRITSTENIFIILVYSSVDFSKDYVINLSVNSIQEDWKIRKNSRDFRVIREISRVLTVDISPATSKIP